ncbi:hypothetical protein AYI69_g131 [Smittium culicis]|uniref:Uncharacterized protein n=1 Tax=Smittium culicis TaxID=133412 RepID=A0A1R1YTZ7_9FUNG|nr:hypothetical protein AYI69_g131 [Smittium culicis]
MPKIAPIAKLFRRRPPKLYRQLVLAIIARICQSFSTEGASGEEGHSRPVDRTPSWRPPRNDSICVDKTEKPELAHKQCLEEVIDPIQ